MGKKNKVVNEAQNLIFEDIIMPWNIPQNPAYDTSLSSLLLEDDTGEEKEGLCEWRENFLLRILWLVRILFSTAPSEADQC